MRFGTAITKEDAEENQWFFFFFCPKAVNNFPSIFFFVFTEIFFEFISLYDGNCPKPIRTEHEQHLFVTNQKKFNRLLSLNILMKSFEH